MRLSKAKFVIIERALSKYETVCQITSLVVKLDLQFEHSLDLAKALYQNTVKGNLVACEYNFGYHSLKTYFKGSYFSFSIFFVLKSHFFVQSLCLSFYT